MIVNRVVSKEKYTKLKGSLFDLLASPQKFSTWVSQQDTDESLGVQGDALNHPLHHYLYAALAVGIKVLPRALEVPFTDDPGLDQLVPKAETLWTGIILAQDLPGWVIQFNDGLISLDLGESDFDDESPHIYQKHIKQLLSDLQK